jgi:hypothetical protein
MEEEVAVVLAMAEMEEMAERLLRHLEAREAMVQMARGLALAVVVDLMVDMGLLV